MARILAIADLHENIDFLDKISRLVDYDAILLCGDIVELRTIDFVDFVSKTKRKILIISGDHDCVPCYRKIAKKYSNVEFLYRGLGSIEINGEEIRLLYLSGIYSKKKRNMTFYNDRDILGLVRKTIREHWEADIAITHTPPYHMADYLPKGGRGGLKQLLIFRDICRPKWWISGHTHVLATEKVGETIAINCGIGYIGDLVIMDTKHRSVILGRYLSGEVPDIEDPTWDFIYYMRKTDSYIHVLKTLSKVIE